MARNIEQSGATPASTGGPLLRYPFLQSWQTMCVFCWGRSARGRSSCSVKNWLEPSCRSAQRMLLLLDAQGPTSQHMIGQQMRLERSTMSLAADELERNRLVRRRRAPADRRLNELELTARGRRAVDDIKIATDHTTDTLLAPLTLEEQQQLLALLQRIL